jgi:hypothetical protein
VLVKLADRLSNVQRLDRHPRPEKRRPYYRETVEWILPLAARVPFFDEEFGRWRMQADWQGRVWLPAYHGGG